MLLLILGIVVGVVVTLIVQFCIFMFGMSNFMGW